MRAGMFPCRGERQRGAVLVVGLIMLAVITLFVVSMFKTSVIELKIGGASQVAAVNFANAEVAIDNYIQLNNGRFAPNFLTLVSGPGAQVTTPASVIGGTVVVTATQLYCGPLALFGTQLGAFGLQAAQFDLRADATSDLGTTIQTVLHQGVRTLATAGGC